ncbi:MAG: hypothetical protein KY393_03350 [Actinobacteria bacterium]|nr:hypothetical protein [Actinomycetota bacterium]
MKKFLGLMLATGLASMMMAVVAFPAFAGSHEEANTGGQVYESGDADDCVGGSCGGVIVEDPAGTGPNCDGGNCGGSVCEGTDCGSCEGGNCGGSISGPGVQEEVVKVEVEKKAHVHAPKALPRTGVTLPAAATAALGLGMVLVGAFFTFVANPSTKMAMAALSYTPKRRL